MIGKKQRLLAKARQHDKDTPENPVVQPHNPFKRMQYKKGPYHTAQQARRGLHKIEDICRRQTEYFHIEQRDQARQQRKIPRIRDQ